MRNNKVVLLGEGITEKKVLKALNIIGEFKSFNIWQKDIIKLLPSLGQKADLWFYVDTDKSDNSREFKRFSDNIDTLKNSKITFKIYLQVKHLEDELERACLKCIYQGFSVKKGSSELKEKIMECSNLEQKLSELQIDKTKLWQQAHGKCDAIVEACRWPKIKKQ